MGRRQRAKGKGQRENSLKPQDISCKQYTAARNLNLELKTKNIEPGTSNTELGTWN
jgi:hypothetical protein